MKSLWLRVLVSLDQLGNVLLSAFPSLMRKGFGDEDETVSSVVGKRYYLHDDRHWFICAVFHLVEYFDAGHFRRHIEYDEGRDRKPKD